MLYRRSNPVRRLLLSYSHLRAIVRQLEIQYRHALCLTTDVYMEWREWTYIYGCIICSEPFFDLFSFSGVKCLYFVGFIFGCFSKLLAQRVSAVKTIILRPRWRHAGDGRSSRMGENPFKLMKRFLSPHARALVVCYSLLARLLLCY